jgi:hypothetical protein
VFEKIVQVVIMCSVDSIVFAMIAPIHEPWKYMRMYDLDSSGNEFAKM